MNAQTGNPFGKTGYIVAAAVAAAIAIGAAWVLWPNLPLDSEVAQTPAAASSGTEAPVTAEATPQEQPAATDKEVVGNDVAGNTEATTTPQGAPETDEPASGFDVVRVEPDGSAVIAGHADPGSTIQLTLNGEALEDVEVGSDGNFVALLDLPTDTPGALGISSLDDSGAVVEGQQSSQTVLIAPVTQPARAPSSPVATDTDVAVATTGDGTVPTEEEAVKEDTQQPDDIVIAAAPQVLLADEDGISVLQDGSGLPSVDNVVIDAITYDDGGEVALSGRGQSGASLRVYLDNTPIETGTISQSGQWRVPLPDVDGGVYTLRIDEIAEDGSVTSRTQTPFKREEPQQLAVVSTDNSGPAPRVEAVTVQPGSTLWAIAREHLGEGPLYVRVFAANRDQIADPDLIYPGQVFAIPDEEAE